MNINNRLAKYLEDSNPLEDSGLNQRLIEFLNSSMSLKQELAQSLVKEIVKPHNKDQLVNHIAELYKVESATMSLTGKRDHVVHAINTFILGLFINHNYLNKKVDLFQWKLAALFHDIAYPLEISPQIMERYIQKISEIKSNLSINHNNPTLNLIPENFDQLTNNISAFDLIQQTVNSWGLDVSVKKRYEDMIKNNQLNHGILSSLTVLYLIDLMYQKNNSSRDNADSRDGWKQQNFESDIVSACTAIYLHNLYHNNFFKNCKNKSKLAYLLKLCDELQNWDRPTKDAPEGDSADNYDIIFQKDILLFKSTSKDTRKKTSKDIACLNDDFVRVVEGFNGKN